MVAIHTSLADLPAGARQCAVAVGAFDGLHLGHQALLRQAAAGGGGNPVMILTFEPPPKLYFNPRAHAGRLTTPRTRALAAGNLGVAHILELPFDAAMAAMEAEAFARLLCGQALGATHLVVGHDFAFGRGRTGDVSLLQAMAAEARIGVSVVQPVQDAAGTRISSTRIREALEAGNLDLANSLLGRPWLVEGVVVHGEKRGRLLGWPTANMVLGDQLAPRFGIYVVSATLPDGRSCQGVANFGRTPTTGLRDPLLEVNLFDFEGDLYGQRLDVQFHSFLRPEAKFDGLDALVAQIGADAANARQWFANRG